MYTRSTPFALILGELSGPLHSVEYETLNRRSCYRMKFVFEKLVTHLHDFAREVSLTTDEWMQVPFRLSSSVRRSLLTLQSLKGLAFSSSLLRDKSAPTSGAPTFLVHQLLKLD